MQPPCQEQVPRPEDRETQPSRQRAAGAAASARVGTRFNPTVSMKIARSALAGEQMLDKGPSILGNAHRSPQMFAPEVLRLRRHIIGPPWPAGSVGGHIGCLLERCC